MEKIRFIGLFVSTLYLRYHYLVDVAAGLILVPLSYNWLFDRYGESHLTVIFPAALVLRYPRLGSSAPKIAVAEKAEEPL